MYRILLIILERWLFVVYLKICKECDYKVFVIFMIDIGLVDWWGFGFGVRYDSWGDGSICRLRKDI